METKSKTSKAHRLINPGFAALMGDGQRRLSGLTAPVTSAREVWQLGSFAHVFRCELRDGRTILMTVPK